MDKKNYLPPRIIEYLPDQVPATIIQLFLPKIGVTAPLARIRSQELIAASPELLHRNQH